MIILDILSVSYPKLAQRRTWYTHGSRRGRKRRKGEKNGSKSKGPDGVEQRLHVYIPIESGSIQSVRNFYFIFLNQIMEPGATWNGCHIPPGLH